MPRPTMYQPLVDFLAEQDADIVRLSFDAIEEILSFALPISAHAGAGWWRSKWYRWVRAWTMIGWHAWPVVSEHVVVFSRLPDYGEAFTPPAGPSRRGRKYQPLADFLATQDEDSVRLTFARIEALTGFPLPDTAYASMSYWRPSPPGRLWMAIGWEAVQLDRRGQAVVFRRLRKEGIMPRPGGQPRPSKYQPLADFLARQVAPSVRLSFAEIERLLGFPLPVSAYGGQMYWQGEAHAWVRTWMAVGWEARLHLHAPAVVFTRIAREE